MPRATSPEIPADLARLSTRRLFLTSTAAATAAAAIPAFAFASQPDGAELAAAYAEVIAAHEAFNVITTDDRWDELSDRWTAAQHRFMSIPATTLAGVALKLRFSLATHSGWFPAQGFYSEPADASTFGEHWDARLVHDAIGVIERLAAA